MTTTEMICPACQTDGSASVMDIGGACPNCGHREVMTRTTTNGNTTTATVETLTAEVRVLMVGSRQVTLSVFKQLDVVPLAEIEVFGRTSSGREYRTYITSGARSPVELVGRSTKTGALVRSWAAAPEDTYTTGPSRVTGQRYTELASLPLIVLAGLR